MDIKEQKAKQSDLESPLFLLIASWDVPEQWSVKWQTKGSVEHFPFHLPGSLKTSGN